MVIAQRRQGPRAAGRTPIIVSNSLAEWAIAILICYGCFQAMWSYHALWRHKPYSLGTANESFALASTMGLAMALGIGPLSRLTGGLRRALRLRRPVALIAVLAGLIHAGLCLFVAFGKVTWQVDSIVFGVVGTLLLLALVATSRASMLARLGADTWRRLQAWGYPALVLVVAHYLVLGKIPSWVSWVQTRDYPAPPGTFPVTALVVLVLLVKLLDLARAARRSREEAA